MDHPRPDAAVGRIAPRPRRGAVRDDRDGDPPAVGDSQGRAAGGGQLRRDAGRAPRERAVRARPRRVHRRELHSRRPVPSGRQRHDPARRDRRDAPRIARTFAVDDGAYVVEERIGIPVLPGIDVDVRSAIYAGMRQHLPAARLADTVRRFGTGRILLRASGEGDLGRFGFGAEAVPVLAALRAGTTLPELLAKHVGLDPRLADALVCTLAVCDALVLAVAPAPRASGTRDALDVRSAVTGALPRVPTPRDLHALPALGPARRSRDRRSRPAGPGGVRARGHRVHGPHRPGPACRLPCRARGTNAPGVVGSPRERQATPDLRPPHLRHLGRPRGAARDVPAHPVGTLIPARRGCRPRRT